MDRGNVNPTQHLPWWLRETTKKAPISLIRTGIWTRNSPNTRAVWWISIGAILCAFKNYITYGLHSRPELEYEPPSSTPETMLLWNSGSSDSACVMWRHYYITYTQSLHAINGFLTVGWVGNLLYERLSCHDDCLNIESFSECCRMQN